MSFPINIYSNIVNFLLAEYIFTFVISFSYIFIYFFVIEISVIYCFSMCYKKLKFFIFKLSVDNICRNKLYFLWIILIKLSDEGIIFFCFSYLNFRFSDLNFNFIFSFVFYTCDLCTERIGEEF